MNMLINVNMNTINYLINDEAINANWQFQNIYRLAKMISLDARVERYVILFQDFILTLHCMEVIIRK